jgi:quinoprotein glucose dehydrogenase
MGGSQGSAGGSEICFTGAKADYNRRRAFILQPAVAEKLPPPPDHPACERGPEGYTMVMRPCVLLFLFAVPLAARADTVAGVETFASAEMTGQPLALAADDAGRVYLSCTGRAFGRGVPDVSQHAKLHEEDTAIFSLPDRRKALQRWEKDGILPAAKPEASESVICLMDTDGDGRADQRTEVAGDFYDMLDGPAGGVWPLPDGGLLFGCAPSLWRLEDDNGDQRADRRLPLLTGFGIRCGEGMSGICALTGGPDGFIYFTTGNRGSRITSAEGQRFVLEGTGGVWRCLPDGTDLELLASGLYHPAGIAVDLRGRIFVADVLPGAESTRLLRVLPGADFTGGFDGLEIGTLPVRVTGFILDPTPSPPGAPLRFLLADGRPAGSILPVTVEEVDGKLRCQAGSPVWRGSAACGLTLSTDGSILWAEWHGGFQPAATASILRLPPRENTTAWREGADLLQQGFTTNNSAGLPALLEHPHPIVRRRACRALARLGFQESLDHFTRAARRSPSMPARFEALWGLAALARDVPMLLNEVQLLTGSAEPDIRALAVHIIGETSRDMPVQELLPLLRDPSRDVREEVAIALGRLRPPGIAEEIFTALHQCGESDPALRHALIFALSRLLPAPEIAARGRSASSAPVKSAAVAALTSLRAAEIADFLDDENPAIVLAAGRAIHRHRILPGYPLLATALEKAAIQPALQDREFVHRALAAAAYLGSAEAAAPVAAFAGTEGLAAELRAAALQKLETWDAPSAFDAAFGDHHLPLPRPPGLTRPYLARLKPDDASAKPDATTLATAFQNENLPETLRAEALQQLSAMQPSKALELARSILPAQGPPVLRAAARTVIMRLDAAASYAQLQEALTVGSVPEMQSALLLAQKFDSKQSNAFWLAQGKKFLEDKVAPAIRLEVWEGLQQRDVAPRGPFRRLLESVDAAFDESADPLARWRICEFGGDPAKGRILYETGRALTCTACHSLLGRGGTSGPELDEVAGRLNRSQLLAALIQPSATVSPGGGRVTVTLEEGATITGILKKRDDTSLLLVTPQGHRRINADTVQSLSEPVSPMPAASTLLTPREVRDLLAWLETLK